MLVQNIGNTQLVYVDNYLTDYKTVAERFGLLDNNGLRASFATIRSDTYINKNGISIPAYYLKGRTVNIYVINDCSYSKSTRPDDIASALNYFQPDSRLKICGFDFVGKFTNVHSSIVDSNGRYIATNADNYKDLRGIYDLMKNMSVNNGKLFEPVLARYVYASREMPKNMPLVGYLDLHEYLHIINDERALLFSYRKTKASVMIACSKAPVIKIIGIDNASNDAYIEMQGISEAYDCKKMNDINPMVIFTKSPLKISTMRFPWSKVIFDKTPVFMTPIMSKMDAWETLQGGLDLLSVPKK